MTAPTTAAELCAEWAKAGSDHMARCRDRGIRVPPGFRDQVLGFKFLSQLGADGQPDPRWFDFTDSGCMSPLTLTKRDAAQLLGVSETTIKKLIGDGDLPLVHIRGSARLLRVDVEAYASSLRSPRVVTK